MIEPDFHQCLLCLKDSFEGGNEATLFAQSIESRFNQPKLAMLDVGVGAGTSTVDTIELLRKAGYSVDTVFIEPNIPEYRRGILETYGKLIECKFEDIDLPATFDIVKSTHSIYYLGEPSASLKLMMQLVNLKGALLLTSWSRDCILYKLYDRVFREEYPEYSAESLIELALDANLQVDVDLIYSEGTVNLESWRNDEDICRASCRLVSRDTDALSLESIRTFRQALRPLHAVERRVNGTLVITWR